MSLARSKDAGFLNSVINDPSVLPYVACGISGPLDAEKLVENDNNYFLANEYGGLLFVPSEPYVYQGHMMFLPQGRGYGVLGAAREAFFFMFTETDAIRLDAIFSHENTAVERLMKAMGFTKWGDVEVNGIPSHLYVLTLKEWARGLKCL